MESTILTAVLSAAFLHAFWNFLVKSNDDKPLAMLAICLGHIPFGILGLLYNGLPPLSTYSYLLLSAIFHSSYQVFLMHAYRIGDLSAVYPIARGLSPLLLSLATVVIGQDVLTQMEVLGILMIGASLFIFGFSQYKVSENGLKGLILAVITGLFIASYSMVDALGTRHAGNALQFFGMLSLINGISFSLYFWVWHRSSFQLLMTKGKKTFWIGGGASYSAYAIVLWACLHAPVAVVSSLRETSTIFAVLFGVVILKEKLTAGKILAAFTVVFGIALTRLG